MYADDTILISEDTKTMNQFIKQIEITGATYGLKLDYASPEFKEQYGNTVGILP